MASRSLHSGLDFHFACAPNLVRMRNLTAPRLSEKGVATHYTESESKFALFFSIHREEPELEKAQRYRENSFALTFTGNSQRSLRLLASVATYSRISLKT